MKVTTRKKQGAPWIIEVRASREHSDPGRSYGVGMDVPDGPEVAVAVQRCISRIDEDIAAMEVK